MSVPMGTLDTPLSEKLTKAIQSEMRKEINGIRRTVDEKNSEIYKLQGEIKELKESRDYLMRSLNIKNGKDTTVDEKLKKISDDIDQYIKDVLETTPKKDWHVGAVWGRASNRFPNTYNIKTYVMTQPAASTASTIYSLLVLIDRYQREVEKYDDNLNRWAKEILVGTAPVISWAGYDGMFACPKGGRCSLSFVDKLLEKSEFNIRAATIPEEKYPKVKV